LVVGLVAAGLIYGRWKLRLLAGVLGATFVGFIAFWVAAEYPPRNIREALSQEQGWCWTRQFWDPAIDESSWLCVRCGDHSCIDYWSQKQHILEVRAYTECNDGNVYDDGSGAR